jgi:hypothetical protein
MTLMGLLDNGNLKGTRVRLLAFSFLLFSSSSSNYFLKYFYLKI